MRILSGIQPSGGLHIGNYFGMMKPMIEYQEVSELYCFIVNFHAMTTVRDGKRLAWGTIQVALDFLALGLDPDKAIFWVQSDVPEVTELTWILNNITPVGLLLRSHSYKEKIDQGLSPNHGLLSYPVLMAADILLYQAHRVPVGKDQQQHLEITRDIAMKFNNTYGETFIIPEAEINPNVPLVVGTDGRKMSKSYDNTIEIFCKEEDLRKKIARIVTDSTPVSEPKNPETCNLFINLSLFMNEEEKADLAERYRRGGLKYSDVKQELFERMWEYFRPAREKRAELEKNLDYIREILKSGAEKAREKATPTINLVRKKVGVIY
ncbi:MAG: tryptophan--tRNA ligase [Deltaproteobacteria bacterium]|nr:tryptophan--tRNA ligase [Deltaproteobacteria bacterium]MBW1920208.1 tryptophan--tRNA ligase [Deltaproteobacteria bacterium]MBW1934754.1 tryptophan--tRNA ligase [Deltaproteobacteria bacterium]MBW1977089.1 tryptophan--tRNA ligase [Deltaproteobacteria bacterium]MBW2044120.1 tryptophan--tRNA ligase [Deltaproteobacteria bacterium]